MLRRPRANTFLIGALAALALFAVLYGNERGAGRTDAQPASGYRYSVKFICGPPPPFGLTTTVDTDINVHNPHPDPVSIQKKAVLAPDEPMIGVPSPRINLTIPPDGAFEIDCLDTMRILAHPCRADVDGDGLVEGGAGEDDAVLIAANFGPVDDPDDPNYDLNLDGDVDVVDLQIAAPADGTVCGFLKGFVVIDSPRPIDVWGVYTSTSASGPPFAGVVKSEDKEVIAGRPLPIAQPGGLAYTYSSKFLCGTVAEPYDPFDPLVPATYGTDINVHNPNEDLPAGLGLLKKVVLAPREPSVGLPSPFVPIQITPDGAFEDGCSTIYQMLGPQAPSEGGLGFAVAPCNDGVDNDGDLLIDVFDPDCFAKGFLVVESPGPLDVVGVWGAGASTMAPPDGGIGGELDVEAVPYTRQPMPAPGKLNLSPYFDCRHQQFGANPIELHIDCILLANPPQTVFDWEVIYVDQSPLMTGPALIPPPWVCSPPGGNWVPDISLLSTRVKCEDQTHGSNPWVVGQCRDISTFRLPGTQGPWNPLQLHATDASQVNLGVMNSFVHPTPRC